MATSLLKISAKFSTLYSYILGVFYRLYSLNVENPDEIAEAFGKCKELEDVSGLWDLDEGSVMMLMPIAARLTRLDLTYALLGQPELTDLLSACVNLEDLQVCIECLSAGIYFPCSNCTLSKSTIFLFSFTQH